jgi:hypothetical protein
VAAVPTTIRWVSAVAFAAFAMALVTAWFAVDPTTLYLDYSVSLFGLLALPGFVLMRQAKAAA